MSEVNGHKSMTKICFWYWAIENTFPSGIPGVFQTMMPVTYDEDGMPEELTFDGAHEISRRHAQINKFAYVGGKG